MKKHFVMLSVFALAAICAFAGASVYQRSIQALPVTTGSATWTNNLDNVRQGAIILKKLWVIGDLAAGDTVTVSRLSVDGTWANTNTPNAAMYTQAVCTVYVNSNAGNTNSFTEPYLTYGDKLVFSSAATTGSTVMIEYEIQKY